MQKIKLGDIVALISHPFTATNTDVIISGDAQHISPLMVVVETLIESKNIYDEQTGDLKGKKQCRCIWYSNNNFEEAWISSEQLKVIKSEEDSETTFEIGNFVSLKTLDIELGKRKSTLKTQGHNGKEVSISALLSFVPPVMQVIGKNKNESKEPLFDAKTGIQKRYISKNLIKCKWYNPSSDKMSEKLLPIEVLQNVPPVNQKLLDKIAESKYLKIKFGDTQTLIKPQDFAYRSGYYYLNAFNYLSNKIEEYDLSKIEFVDNPEKYFIKKHLDFEALGIDFTPKNIQLHQDAIIDFAKEGKRYIQIEYKNKNGGILTRTVKDFEVIKVKVDDTDFDSYLVGYCMSKQELRHFKLERIEKICVLDLTFAE